MGAGRIPYSQCWEDADLLTSVLVPGTGGRCLSVTSGGDNSLALLAGGMEEVASIDHNPVQNHLLELKGACIYQLEYNEILRFLGVESSTNRLQVYLALRPLLSVAARNWWDQKQTLISAGIIHTGDLERFLNAFRKYVHPLVHPLKTRQKTLVELTPGQRQQFINEEWRNMRWGLACRLALNEFVVRKLGRHKSAKKPDKVSNLFTYKERAEAILARPDAAHNPYLHYLLSGSFPRHCLPYYLRKESIASIKKRWNHITIVTDSLSRYLNQDTQTFDAFNLSNIFDHCSNEKAQDIYNMITKTASPDAHIAYWKHAGNAPTPFENDKEYAAHPRETQLNDYDQLFFYEQFRCFVYNNHTL